VAERALAFRRDNFGRQLAVDAELQRAADALLVARDRAASASAESGTLERIRDVDELGLDDAGDVSVAVNALRLAVDRDDVRATAPLSSGDVLLVAPVYGSDADITSTAGRRAGAAGWVVATFDPDEIVSEAFHPDTNDVVVRVTDGSVLLAGSSDPSIGDRLGAASRNIDVHGRTWVMTYAPDRTLGRVPASGWAILVAGLCLAAGVAVVTRQADLRRRAAATEAAARNRELGLIAELGPLLQQSLDIADFIPAVVVRIADEFACDRVGVAVESDDGDLVELFSFGGPGRIHPDPARLPPTPVSAAPGEEVYLPLQRAGRTIGTLRVRSNAGIDAFQMHSLHAAAELLAATVANAQLFQREQQTVVRLQEVDQLKTAFLGTASHELRTPVAAIRGFAELLDGRWAELTDDQRRDFVARIARNSSSLAALVQDLLDFARLERGALRVHNRSIPLSELVNSVVEQLSSLTAGHEMDLHLEPGVHAHADPDALTRVVSNLVSNAIKFSPAGSRVTITVAARRVPGGSLAELIVDDEGPGVPESEHERIFSRFYRGDADIVTRTRGAGIGLAVVRDLVGRMEGSVSVGQSPAGGARFTVVLPTEPADAERGLHAAHA
jgi:signal transduction histidine kinase